LNSSKSSEFYESSKSEEDELS